MRAAMSQNYGPSSFEIIGEIMKGTFFKDMLVSGPQFGSTFCMFSFGRETHWLLLLHSPPAEQRLEKLRREEQEKLHSFQLLKQRLGCNPYVSGMLKPCALVF